MQVQTQASDDADSLTGSVTLTLPAKISSHKIRERPSHDLELAKRLTEQHRFGGGRMRARTEETGGMESDASSGDDSSSDGSLDNDCVQKSSEPLPPTKGIFSLFRPKTSHPTLVQRIDSDDTMDSLPDDVRRPSAFQSSEKQHASSKATELSLPQPQRRPPSFHEVSAVLAKRPSKDNAAPVGSIRGAFTRIQPTVEGVSREVIDVDNQGLRIKWTHTNAQTLSNVDSQDTNPPNRSLNSHSPKSNRENSLDTESILLSTMENGESIAFSSQPNSSAISSASAAWHHMKTTSYQQTKTAGSVRTGTDTSGSLSENDDTSSLQTIGALGPCKDSRVQSALLCTQISGWFILAVLFVGFVVFAIIITFA